MHLTSNGHLALQASGYRPTCVEDARATQADIYSDLMKQADVYWHRADELEENLIKIEAVRETGLSAREHAVETLCCAARTRFNSHSTNRVHRLIYKCVPDLVQMSISC